MNKNARKLGLHPLLAVDQHALRVYKMSEALPLLPANSIITGYEYILAYATVNGVRQEMDGYLDYVHRVWIVGT